jgi:hypothetical protein
MAHDRAFTVALVVSTLFHLSMVSVFSIVIRFPAQGVRFYPLSIVEQAAAEPVRMPHRDILQTSSPDRLLDENAEAENESLDALPAIELPKLQFTTLDPLRTREESLRIRSQFSDLFESRPQETPDSWALFTRELRGIGPTLTRWTFPEAAREEPPRLHVSSLVPGIGVYVEWMSEPKARKILFSPPIPALWNLDPGQLTEPLALVFTVNAQGKVTDVQSPIEDEAGAVAGIKEMLFKYVFESLGMEETKDQRGRLLVTAEASTE